MASLASPPPIPGKPIDPPPKGPPKILEEQTGFAGIAYRAFSRFTSARATLLAAGTTYYLFLAMFALLAFGYGVAAAFGTDQFTAQLTETLEEALPGLVGTDGIDPEQLRATGRASSLVGLLLLLYSGGGAMVAASGSLHLIYGAPPDPRSFLKARAVLLGWLLIIAPIILVSFAIPTVVISVAESAAGLPGSTAIPPSVWFAGALIVVLVIDFAIMYLLLGVLGGIRPERFARGIGAATGAVTVSVLKYFLGAIIAWSIARPQYGAFALPITVLFVLYLLTIALYGSAALTAGIADRGVPLDELTSADIEDGAAT